MLPTGLADYALSRTAWRSNNGETLPLALLSLRFDVVGQSELLNFQNRLGKGKLPFLN